MRAAAAEGLAALKATGPSARRSPPPTARLRDADLDARLAAVGALAAQNGRRRRGRRSCEAARTRSRRAWCASRAAAALASAVGAKPPAPGPRRHRPPALDYREAMAPYDPAPTSRCTRPRAILHTRHGKIEIHLNVVEAPLTSASFMDLARRGFYDGLTFHRVVPGFVVQGG